MRALTAALLFSLAWTPLARAQAGDAEFGKVFLQQRGCTDCHALEGEGGQMAADLAELAHLGLSPTGLAARMWEHAPMMWEAMEQAGRQPTALSEYDLANIYAYFYSLEFGDPAGDAARGRNVFREKHCAQCHAMPGDEAEPAKFAGPAVETWPSMADATLWLQEMWNHADGMSAALEKAGLGWPELDPQSMADLVAFLRTMPPHDDVVAYNRLGDPANGAELFESQGCAGCHTFGDESGKRPLTTPAEEHRLSGLATALWNHRPLMAAAGASFQPLELDQLADLTTYLFREGFASTRGDASRGERLLAEKRCTQCHGAQNPDIPAPDLPLQGERFTGIRMASVVWTHGPNMKLFMDYLEEQWPDISEQEMADLIAYLNK